MSCMTEYINCHWRWQCHVPLFASFVNRIKASLPNMHCNGEAAEIATSHSCQVIISFLEIWTTRCLQLLLVILRSEDYIWSYLTWINWCSSCLGNYLAIWWARTCRTCSTAVSFALKSEVDLLKMWVHKRTRAKNNHTNHYQSNSW